MLKSLKKQLPVARITQKAKTKTVRKSRATRTTRDHSPVEICKRIGYTYSHFIIYPSSGGYRFTLFCRIEKGDPLQVVAESPKGYKLKSECIKTIKTMMYCIGDTFMKSYIVAFDHKGNKINLKIEYNVNLLL